MELELNKVLKGSIEATVAEKAVNNHIVMNLGNHIKSVRFQEYRMFENSSDDTLYTTYLNTFDFGIFINDGNILKLTTSSIIRILLLHELHFPHP